MAVQDHFSQAEKERQAQLDASWAAGLRCMADPDVRDRIMAGLAALPDRTDDLSPAQAKHQAAIERSQGAVERVLADPELFEHLRLRLAEIDSLGRVEGSASELLRLIRQAA